MKMVRILNAPKGAGGGRGASDPEGMKTWVPCYSKNKKLTPKLLIYRKHIDKT